MAITPEVAREISNFQPNSSVITGEQIDMGEVGEGERLVQGLLYYQLRRIGLPGQPRISGEFTTQPGIGIKKEVDGKDIVIPIVYSADVDSIGEKRAALVLDCIRAFKARMV